MKQIQKKLILLPILIVLAFLYNYKVYGINKYSESPKDLLSLQDCISTSLMHNPELLNAKYSLEIAEIEDRIKKKLRLGNMELLLQNDISNKFVSYYGTDRYYDGKLVYKLPFYDNSILPEINKSTVYIYLMQEEYEDKIQEISYDIYRTYFNIVKQMNLINLKKAEMNKVKRYSDIISKKYEEKLVTSLDKELIENNYSFLNNQLFALRNTLGSIEKHLLILMGNTKLDSVDIDDQIKIEDTLKYSGDDYIKLAEKRNHDLIKYKINEQMIDIEKSAIKAESMPFIGFSGSLGYEGEDINRFDKSWNVNCNMNFRLWAWGKNKQEYKRIKIEKLKAINEQQYYKRKLISMVEMYYATLEQLKEEIDIKVTMEDIRRREYDNEESKYLEGMSSIKELLDRKEKWAKTKEELINTKYRYISTKSHLHYLCGVKLNLEMNIK